MSPVRDEGKVETTVREGVVWVRLDGVVLFQTTLAAMRAAADGARAHGTDRIIFDIRAGSYPGFEASALESARHAANVGLGAALRIAILGREGDPKLPFIESVAANRGAQARAFSDEAQAVAWINSRRR
jgi:hypothetical protein